MEWKNEPHCPECGSEVLNYRVIDNVRDIKCKDCGQVFGEDEARPVAERFYSCGRCFLFVAGYVLAMEGDTIRDPEFEGRQWTPDTILDAVKAINSRTTQLDRTEWANTEQEVVSADQARHAEAERMLKVIGEHEEVEEA